MPGKEQLSLTAALCENQRVLAVLQCPEMDLGLHKLKVGQACVIKKLSLALLKPSEGFS